MSGLMDMLAAQPAQADKVMGLLGLLGGSGPQPPGGAPFGDVNPYNGDAAPVQLANQIARRLERRGFEVGGLEGFQGTPESITSGHIDNSQHYSGMAGDVTYGGGGRWNTQNAALDWVEQWLQRRYGDLITENIWQAPDHYDHLHYGTRPGG